MTEVVFRSRSSRAWCIGVSRWIFHGGTEGLRLAFLIKQALIMNILKVCRDWYRTQVHSPRILPPRPHVPAARVEPNCVICSWSLAALRGIALAPLGPRAERIASFPLQVPGFSRVFPSGPLLPSDSWFYLLSRVCVPAGGPFDRNKVAVTRRGPPPCWKPAAGPASQSAPRGVGLVRFHGCCRSSPSLFCSCEFLPV